MSFNLKKATTNVSTISAEGIKQSLSIDSVARHLGISGLKQSGDRLQGACPSGHTSKKGMCFNINLEKNYFNCFHCGEGGDVIRLVEFVKEISFREAMNWLITEFNIDADECNNLSEAQEKSQKTPEEIKQEKEFYTRASLYELVFEYGRRLLLEEEGSEALNYLTGDRSYAMDQIRASEWLYLPESNAVRDYLGSIQPDAKEAIAKLNLNGSYGDNFRLAFPYRNRQGLITGFVKRSLASEGIEVTTRDGQMHSEIRWDSSKGLSKTDLFNLCNCKGIETLLVLEGYPDAMMLPAMGLKNVVAVGQGLLSKSHFEGLFEFGVKSVVLAFDNDGVGSENTITAIELLLSDTDINVFVLDPKKLGDYKDPDEFVRAKGIDKFKDLAESAEAVGKWIPKILVEKFDLGNDLQRQQALNAALCYHLRLKDPLVCDDFIKSLSGILSIPVDLLENKMISFREKREREKIEKDYLELLEKGSKLVKASRLEDAAKLLDENGKDLKGKLLKIKAKPTQSFDYELAEIFKKDDTRDPNKLLGYPLTKFKTISQKINGIQPGFYLLGAETNVGKTAVLTNLTLDVLETNPEVNVLYYSLDDSRVYTAYRFLSILTQFHINEVKKKQSEVSRQELLDDKRSRVLNYIKEKRLIIKDISEVNHIDELELDIREIEKENLIVFIDGLYNLEVGKGTGSIREQNIERATRVKLLVDSYALPIFTTGELRKKTKEESKDKKPTVNDLMETGKFAYNANLVWLLYSNTQEELKQDEPLLTLEYVKNKLSDFRGNQSLTFKRATGTMEEFRLGVAGVAGIAEDSFNFNQARELEF
jgi:DNA primase catalytic core